MGSIYSTAKFIMFFTADTFVTYVSDNNGNDGSTNSSKNKDNKRKNMEALWDTLGMMTRDGSVGIVGSKLVQKETGLIFSAGREKSREGGVL